MGVLVRHLREVEGIEGTKLNEVVVPAGRSRTLNYTVPDAAGTQKVKCYAPGGATTIIEIVVVLPAPLGPSNP